ncbi:MAG TPA: hypothetical protein VK463_07430 [Desulfomonilaceae bacterium]|nr:hypothetical protein [Desulfomonilaceae bacterium]
MNVISEEWVCNENAVSSMRDVAGQISGFQPLFPDDGGILQTFDPGPDMQELHEELTYALKQVERFLSDLINK